METVLFSTTESVPGYRIVKRVHFIHAASDADYSHMVEGCGLEEAHSLALKKLEKLCESLGANACIGLQSNYLGGPKMKTIIASLSGTAVFVEPE